MTQSGLCVFNKLKKKATKQESGGSDHVQGWLLEVSSFQEEKSSVAGLALSNMNRAESIHSIDSVDLDDLINANYTTDMGDETDLPDLAYLDIIDDSTEDFWNLNLSDEATSSSDNEFNEFMLTSVELEWDSPTEKVPAPRLKKALYPHKRSGSFSSDTSLASQSTFRYSSLHSSRPVSRQSNTSSPRSPRIPTPTRSTKKSSSIPTPFNRTGQMPCRSPTLSSRLFPEESRIPSPTQRPSGLRTPSTVSTLFPKKTRNKVIQLTALNPYSWKHYVFPATEIKTYCTLKTDYGRLHLGYRKVLNNNRV